MKTSSTPYTVSYNPLSQSNTNNINPSLVVFPFNFPDINILNSDDSTWKLGQNKEKKLKHDKSLLGVTPKIIYESRVKPKSNRSEYVIGIKTKRSIALYDIDSIFATTQKIRKVEENKTIDLNNEVVPANKLDLMVNFGTAKAQKLAINMKTNIVDEHNISSVNAAKQLLKQTGEEANNEEMLLKEKKLNQLNTMSEILPKYDIETKDVTKIFDFNSICPNSIVDTIDHKPMLKILKNKCKGIESNEFKLCEFTEDYLRQLSPKIMQGKNMSNKIKYTLFVNQLIRFYLMSKTIRETPEKLSEMLCSNKEIVAVILEQYTKPTSEINNKVVYIKNQVLILRNIFHILTLCLLLNGYEFDYSLLAKSMRIDMKNMMTYLKEMGCNFKSNPTSGKGKGGSDKQKNTIAQLKAPLKLNVGDNKQGNKRRKH